MSNKSTSYLISRIDFIKFKQYILTLYIVVYTYILSNIFVNKIIIIKKILVKYNINKVIDEYYKNVITI